MQSRCREIAIWRAGPIRPLRHHITRRHSEASNAGSYASRPVSVTRASLVHLSPGRPMATRSWLLLLILLGLQSIRLLAARYGNRGAMSANACPTIRSLWRASLGPQSRISLVAIAIMLVIPRLGFAGDCLSSLEEDVDYLEHAVYSDETARRIHARIFCMRADLRTDTNRWSGPIAAAYIRTCRESPLRDRIAAVCRVYLGDSEGLRYEAARTMAHYAIGTSNGEDIYSILVSHRDDPPWLDLAVLGDPRTVTFIRELYSLRRPLGVEKRENVEKLIAMLNCLYHIPTDEAVKQARELSSTETDPLLRERLALVIHRPED